MSSGMNIEEILMYLPHRYPFLLVDRVLSLTPYEKITAIKNVTMNEAYFAGHFPTQPIMPGVLILEAMAQAAVVLAHKSTEIQPGATDGVFLLAGIDNARFRRMVVPGDQLRLEVRMERRKRDIWKMLGESYVGDELACSAELLSMKGK